MDQTATNIVPIANPLPWAAALRRSGLAPAVLRALQGSDLRVQVVAWLRSHCWRLMRGAWQDPLDLDVWSFEFAIRAQAMREAQVALESRGYVLTGGCRWTEGVWSVDVFELSSTGKPGYCSVTAALKREGLVFAPAVAPIIARPKLHLVHGGLSA